MVSQREISEGSSSESCATWSPSFSKSVCFLLITISQWEDYFFTGLVSCQLMLTKNHLPQVPCLSWTHLPSYLWQTTCLSPSALPLSMSLSHSEKEHYLWVQLTLSSHHRMPMNGIRWHTTANHWQLISVGTCLSPQQLHVSPSSRAVLLLTGLPWCISALWVSHGSHIGGCFTKHSCANYCGKYTPNTCLSLSTSRDLKSFLSINFAPRKPQSVLHREHSMERNPKPVASGKNPHHGCHRYLGVVCCPSIDPRTDGSVAVVSAATRS